MDGRPRHRVAGVAAFGARVLVVTLACVAYSLAAQVRPSSIPSEATAPTRVLGESVERAPVDRGTIERAAIDPAGPTTAAPPTTTAPAPAAPAPATGPTTTAVAPETPEPPEAPPTDLELLRTRVLASVWFPWESRLPGWRIEFHPPREGFRGSTRPKERLIRIYERRGSSFEDYLHVTLHEIGHAVDVTLLDDADHRRWNLARGRGADAPWWVASGADDFASGAGDWAESFAWWQGARDDFRSTVAPVPSARQLAVLIDIVG